MKKSLWVFVCLAALAGFFLIRLLSPTSVRATTGSLAALWHFDASLADSSGNGNTGTFVGGAAFNPNFKFGEQGESDAVAFDGTTGYIFVADSASLQITGSLTIEAWIFLPSTPSAGFHVIAAKWGNVGLGTGGYFFALNNGKLHGEISTTGSDHFDVNGATAVGTNAWHHVALVLDTISHTETLYLDGVADGSTTDAGLTKVNGNNGVQVTIGAYNPGTFTGFFSGNIDEESIWSRALAPTEVLASAQAGLHALWHFNETSGTSTADSSGYGNTGTLNGGAAFTSGGSVNSNFGNALHLSSSPDFVQVLDSSTLEPPQITVELWIRSSSPGANSYILDKGASDCAFGSYSLNTASSAPGDLFFDVLVGAGTFVRSPSAPHAGVFDGNWHHVAGTYDGTTVRLYLDGVQQGSGTATSGNLKYGLTTTNDLFIGRFNGTCTLPYAGDVDELHIWARALSADEITFIANATTRAELVVPSEIDQELGSGAVFASEWNYSGSGLLDHAMGLEFIESNDDGSAVINGPSASPPCATDKGSTPGTPLPGGLVGCQIGIGGKSALITGKQILVSVGRSPITASKTLHIFVNLSDGTQLGANFQWQ